MSGKKSDDGREWTGTDLVDRHKVVLALDRIKMRGDETWYDYYHKALNAMAKLPPIDIREQLDNAYMHGATEAEAKYRAILDTMPKVVRCENCNEYQDVHQWCKLHEIEMKPMDFCSYGGRKNATD